MNAKTVLSVLIATVLLSACGNKGPLVLPEKPAAAEPATPEPADEPAPTDDANADEGDGDGDPGH
ncbi:MAG: lipoprotein [Xanthomonadales bacterium]|nr:lipoprotein [Xanthomonadales bacterium]TXI32163.1 MAG: hypothetical protein E6Q64_01910 [Ottowia sp.]